MRNMSELYEHAIQTAQLMEAERAERSWLEVAAPPAVSTLSLYRVIARNDVGLTLTCKRLIRLDGVLSVTGDDVTVYTFQFDVAGLGWAEVAPSIAVNDDIPVLVCDLESKLYCLFPIIGTCVP